MNVIIAGSRNLTDMELIHQAIQESEFTITKIISGGARGIDKLAVAYANQHHINHDEYYAQWSIHGPQAGFLRNELMASFADALIAIWDGTSSGTHHMIKTMQKQDKPVYIKLA